VGTEVAGLIAPASDERRGASGPLYRPTALGLLASVSLLGFYLGTIALVQDWEHAFTQLGEDLPFVAALVAGFGLQVGLYTYLRLLHAQARRAGVTASAGAGGVAMLACCAHHVADVLPVLGLSAAAAFLGAYKTPLLWLSVAVNLAGLIYLAWQVQKVTGLGGSREQ
jgi:hypothetical protein